MKMISVPLLKQGKSNCGPVALRMVLQFFENDVSLKEIVKGVGGVKRYGVRMIKLCEYAQKLGFRTTCYSYNKKMSQGKAEIRKPSASDVKAFLKRRLPVIIVVRAYLLFDEEPSDEGHYIVITGHERGAFYYNDPIDGKRHKIKEDMLLFAWLNNVLDSSAYLLVLQPRKR